MRINSIPLLFRILFICVFGLYAYHLFLDFYIDGNDNGTFDPDSDTAYRVETDYDLATWDGWRQISHPMSDVGVSQEELSKLVGIRLLLISDLNSQPDPQLQVDYGIDFMIFTDGGPLEL